MENMYVLLSIVKQSYVLQPALKICLQSYIHDSFPFFWKVKVSKDTMKLSLLFMAATQL
jgi:hypothetical protein